MTLIVGNVVDVGLDGLDGTLKVWAGFRPELTALIAPSRKTYDIADGAIPAGVEVVPGPAYIEIDVGINATDRVEVTIPDQASVTIQELYRQGYVWRPHVVSEVAQYLIEVRAEAERAVRAAEAAEAADARIAIEHEHIHQDVEHVDAVTAQVAALLETANVFAQDQVPPYLQDAELKRTYARRTIIDAREHGVVADGVTNDAPAWNALVQSCQPGTIITWAGNSLLNGKIVWKSGVSLVGWGWGRSKLSTKSVGVHFPAISWVPGDGATRNTPLVDCTFDNFEIDGSGIESTAPNIAAKGIFTQWHRRCHFLNLFIHDTIGTGLGVDFLDDCLVHGVIAKGCGRNHTGDIGGQAGIGIGTGTWEEEATIVSNCHAIDNGNWGIFYEYQETEPYRGRGLIITGCTARGNRHGFGDRGTAGTVMTGCISHHNDLDGFNVSFGARDGSITGCTSYRNGRDGFGFNNDTRGSYTLRGNRSFENTMRGIYVLGTASNAMRGLTLESNEVYANQLYGVHISGSSATPFRDLMLRGNRIFNNGQGGGSTAHGVRLDCSLTGFMVTGNRIYDDQDIKTQTVGLKLSDGSATSLVDGMIDDNHLLGNATTNLSFGAATRTRVSLRNNAGYVSENSGSMTLDAGVAAANVAHGLPSGIIPSTVIATARGAASVYTNLRDGANIRIARVGATTDALIVDWYVRI